MGGADVMSRSPLRDFIAGLFVLVGIGAVAYLSMAVGSLSFHDRGGFLLHAAFDQTGGLKPRAPVVIAGVKVGQVDSITLDQNYRARVALDLDPSLKIPADTTASIVTAGLLGDRFIELQLGGEQEYLKPGGDISFTESAVILERLIGKLVHGANVESR
jgi:phospholipid/cholesterol/gamma-HCH transport system substrate-binding protein